MALHRNAHEEPDLVIWRDPPLLACVVLWGITALVVAVAA